MTDKNEIKYGPLTCWNGSGVACLTCKTGEHLERLEDEYGGVGGNFEKFRCTKCGERFSIELPD